MKKFIIAAVLCSFFISCSESNELPSSDNQKENNINSKTINYDSDYYDTLLRNYVNSSEYKEWKSAVFNFNQKLNITLNSNIDLTSEESVLEYIKNNIKNTNFDSFETVKVEWNNIKELNLRKRIKFTEVDDFITKAPERVVIDKLDRWVGGNHFSNNVLSDCESDLIGCETDAFITFMKDQRRALQITDDPYSYNQEMNSVEFRFELSLSICAGNFADCELN